MPYKGFKTADGDILLGGGNDRLFGVMCERLGKSEWAQDSRFVSNNVRVKNRLDLEKMIEAITKRKTTQEWLNVFEGSGMPYAAINDVQTTLNHSHSKCFHLYVSQAATNLWIAKARNMVTEVDHPACGPIKLVNTPVKYSYSKPSIRSPPPTLGQHTDEVLQDLLGMTEAEIEELRSEGVIA